jgi:hypothetical protein
MLSVQLATCFLLAIQSSAPPPAQEPPRREPARVPCRQAHGLFFVTVTDADGELLLALLDTGANASAIDPRRAAGLESLGRGEVVGTTGSLEAERVALEGLRLGGRALVTLRATRRELGGLPAPGDEPVDMILGSDAFAGGVLTLDFEAGTVELGERPPPPQTGEGASEGATDRPQGVPMRLDQGIPAIEARIGGVGLWLRIDTGAALFDTPDVYVNVPQHVWTALRVRDPGLAPSSKLSGTGADGTTVDLPVVPVPEARIGPLELERVFLIVQPEAGYFARADAKGFVSNNYLRHLGRVTLDYRAGRMIATQRPR